MHPCERCGEPIADQYRLCYTCYNEQRAPQSVKQAPGVVSYAQPVAVCAPNAQETRQKAIQDAHEENILASAALTEAIKELSTELKAFTTMIELINHPLPPETNREMKR